MGRPKLKDAIPDERIIKAYQAYIRESDIKAATGLTPPAYHKRVEKLVTQGRLERRKAQDELSRRRKSDSMLNRGPGVRQRLAEFIIGNVTTKDLNGAAKGNVTKYESATLKKIHEEGGREGVAAFALGLIRLFSLQKLVKKESEKPKKISTR